MLLAMVDRGKGEEKILSFQKYYIDPCNPFLEEEKMHFPSDRITYNSGRQQELVSI